MYAAASSLPESNRITHASPVMAEVLPWMHRTAPIVIVGLDIVVTMVVVKKFSSVSYIRVDRLLMAVRLMSTWLVAFTATLLLHENCYGYWRQLSDVCIN